MGQSNMPDSESRSPQSCAHEVADVDGRRIAWIAAGLVAALVVVASVAYLAHRFLRPVRINDHTQVSVPVSVLARPVVASAPRLQTAPTLDLQMLRDQKRAMLDRYRWLDQGKGVVQIPIEQAMQQLAERHANRRPGSQTPARKQTEARQ